MNQFQHDVWLWSKRCFGYKVALDKAERSHRFIEEAIELVQSCGCTREEVIQLVDYVYGRPVGEVHQEVGGVLVTLAALCSAHGVDMHSAGRTEFNRIWDNILQIREKQKAKPHGSVIP